MNDQLSHRERCPNCAKLGRDTSADNLAVYNDGHKFCYSCHYNVRSNTIDQIRDNLNQVITKTERIQLPFDLTSEIEFRALEWLSKYEITKDELTEFRISWSPSRQMLVFPVFGMKDQLIAWQGRTFKEDSPKYFSVGNIHDILTCFDQHSTKIPKDGIILVEDMISAIKVSRQYRVMPLFGSNMTRPQLNRMHFLGDTLIFWLDYDKAVESMATALKARQLGFQTGIILSEFDPKDYDDEEINQFVEGIS